MDISANTDRWDRKSWLWVAICIAAIFSSIPLARSLQQLVYDSVGKEFFTYTVFFIVCACLAAVFYYLFFKYKVKSTSQYAWLFLCAGVYIYYAVSLREYPEEAIHFIEYGLLAHFFFRALSARIHDKTIYLTALILVALVGTLDEFVQWLLPSRVWDYRDVGFNSLAGLIFLVAVLKAIRPGIISGPVKKNSLKVLALALTANLIFFGLCLSNTPDTVKRYVSASPGLEWLMEEEPMTEFGYKHNDPEIGTFYSRMTIEEIKSIDLERGEANGKALKLKNDIDGDNSEPEDRYTPYTDRFMFEFGIHLQRRDKKLEEAEEAENRTKLFSEACTENRLLEKYFGVTLKHSEMGWSDEKIKGLQEKASSWEKEHTSRVGRVITFIDLKTAWALILGILALIWVPQLFREKRV